MTIFCLFFFIDFIGTYRQNLRFFVKSKITGSGKILQVAELCNPCSGIREMGSGNTVRRSLLF